MHKTILAMAAVLCGIYALAQDYGTFRFAYGTGETWSFAADKLRMQPVGDSLIVTSANGAQTVLELSRLASGGFATENHVGTTLGTAVGGECTVYTLTGARIGVFHAEEQARRALAPGAYVMKNAVSTHKFIVR